MKQYDKIYTIERDGSDCVLLEATRKTVVEPRSTVSFPIPTIALQERTGLICLTIEELRECFNAGAFSQEDTKGSDECFKEYLQTKGIKLDSNG